MMANYVLEGIIDALLDDKDSRLLQEFEVVVVPFVDKDGVEEGDQGKNRRPHDHNRDYLDSPLYPEVKSIMDLSQNPERPFQLFLDIHCPWIREGRNNSNFIVGSPLDQIWRAQKAFSEILEAVNKSPLPFKASDNLPFGQEWNTSKTACSTFWAEMLQSIKLATTSEIPYALANGAEVNQQTSRAFGHSLAAALTSYLMSRMQQG